MKEINDELIRQCINLGMLRNKYSIPDISDRLQIPEKKLRSLLKTKGIKYTNILTHERMIRLQSIIASRDISGDRLYQAEAAYRTGFTSCFGFQSWFENSTGHPYSPQTALRIINTYMTNIDI